MNALYKKSLDTLELPAVLQMLSACAVSADAKDECLKLQPLTDAEDIRELQAQTTAACNLITLKGTPSFGDVKDITPSLPDVPHPV